MQRSMASSPNLKPMHTENLNSFLKLLKISDEIMVTLL